MYSHADSFVFQFHSDETLTGVQNCTHCNHKAKCCLHVDCVVEGCANKDTFRGGCDVDCNVPAQHRHSGCGVVVGGVVVCLGQRHQVHKGARRSGDSGVGVRPAGRHTRSLDASRCHTMQESRARMRKPPTGQPRSGAAASQAAAAAAETTGRTQTCNAPTITPTQTQQHILHPQHCLTRFGPFAECCQCCRTARCLDP